MALSRTRVLKPAKKLHKLLRKLDADSTPKQVHDLRTNVRRLQSFYKAVDPDGASIPKSALKDLDRLHKYAGKVRDLDVLTKSFASVHSRSKEEHRIQLLDHLGVKRQKQAGKLYAKVKHIRADLTEELDKTSSRIAKLLVSKAAGTVAPNVVANAAATALRLSAELAEPLRLNKTNLHPYRLKVKELADILLLAESPSHLGFVEDLCNVKDAIGGWHDWKKLLQTASKLLDHDRNSSLLTELKHTARTKYDRAIRLALRLRKNYLGSATPQGSVPGSSLLSSSVLETIARLAG